MYDTPVGGSSGIESTHSKLFDFISFFPKVKSHSNQKIKELYLKGLSSRQIADNIDVSKSTVSKKIKDIAHSSKKRKFSNSNPSNKIF